jgi:hypothetical protein
MSFASPLWLLGLLPWAALVLWLLSGRRERTHVPFLDLWRGPTKGPRVRAALHAPPVALLCLMAAMMFAIVGAARPVVMRAPRTAEIKPTTQPTQNAWISAVAARAAPRAQVMIRVANDSDLPRAELKVGDRRQPVEFPPRGQEKNYFVDLERADAVIETELLANDDVPADNRATLTRRQAWPLVQASGDLPPEVRRIIDAYAKLRPAGEMSAPVIVTSTPRSRPAIVVAQIGNPLPAGPVHVEDHPVTAHVDWSKAIANAWVAAAPAGENWRPIVSVGERTLVAVREAPARQVWIGFGSETWPQSSDFVICYTNALDWAGQGGDVYDAVLAKGAPASAPSVRDVPSGTKAIELGSWLMIVAMGMVFLGAVLWTSKAHGPAVALSTTQLTAGRWA